MPNDRLLTAEAIQDVSVLIHELAASYWNVAIARGAPRSLLNLCEIAHHLVEDRDDWETTARAAGWKPEPGDMLNRVYLDTTKRDGEDESYYHAASWEEACNRLRLEPVRAPVQELWVVTDWLADRLEEHGERIAHDFAGMTIWARTGSVPLHSDALIRFISAAQPERHP